MSEDDGATNIPALCDQVIRDLAEARDLDGVLKVRDQAEALRIYALRRGAAVRAQNRCAEIVALAERRIGRELTNAREEGRLARHGDNRHTSDEVANGNLLRKLTLADIGLRKDQAKAFKDLAAAPEAAIRETVAAASAEGRPVRKAEIKRAVAQTKERPSGGAANTKPAASMAGPPLAKTKVIGGKIPERTRQEAATARPPHLSRFSLSLRSLFDLLPECGDPERLAAVAAEHRVFLDPAVMAAVAEFLTALASATGADRAA